MHKEGTFVRRHLQTPRNPFLPTSHLLRQSASKWIATVLFCSISVWLLSESFLHNTLEVGLPGQFDGYQPSGKMTIKESMRIVARHGLWANCGLSYDGSIENAIRDANRAATNSWGILPEQELDVYRERVYTSQPLFHREVFSAVFAVTGGDLDTFYHHLESVMGVLLAVVLTLFAWQLGREFGLAAAVLVVASAMCSDWLVFVARSPYDVYFLKLAPFLATWLLYPRVLDGRMHFSTLVVLVGVLVLLNAASVYEFISSVILGASVGLVYFGIARGQEWQTILRRVAAMTVAGIAAFVLVLSLHFIQVSIFRGSPHEALQRIGQKVAARTWGAASSFQGDEGVVYHDSAPPSVSAGAILHQYTLLKGISIPFAGAEQRIYLTFFSLIIVSIPFYPFAFVDAGIFPVIGRYRERLVGLAGALATSFAGTMVWPLAAKGRMFHHLHLDAILFYLTFVLMVYAAIGATVSTCAQQLLSDLKRRWAGG